LRADALIHEAEDVVAVCRAAEVTIKVDAPQITISAIRPDLQVFTHLLDNAIKLSQQAHDHDNHSHCFHHVIVA